MIFEIFKRIGFDNLKEMINRQLILQPMDVYLYVKGFGEDCMSDLITNLLFKEFIQYTENIILNDHLDNLPKTSLKTGWSWNPTTHQWEQFTYNVLVDFKDKPLTLVPKRFLTDKYRYNPQRFFQGVILEHLQEKYCLEHSEEKNHLKNLLKLTLSTQLKEISQRKVTLLNIQ